MSFIPVNENVRPSPNLTLELSSEVISVLGGETGWIVTYAIECREPGKSASRIIETMIVPYDPPPPLPAAA